MPEIEENIENTAENGQAGKRKFEIAGGQDLPDSPDDEKQMRSEEIILDLPDVEDIPGQEHIKPPSLGMLADITISSDDEEGVGIFDEDDEDTDDIQSFIKNSEADVTTEEKNDLQQADEAMPTTDEANLRNAALDNTDDEGEPLNEKGLGEDISGSDIDVPGAESDDLNEEIGEEDEENNPYSLDDSNDENQINQ